MNYINMFLGSIFLLCSCKDNAIDNKYAEVMQIHDEVMPLMSNIHQLKKDIKSLSTTDSLQSTQQFQMLEKLEAADEGMMEWMAAFSLPDDESLQMKYLESEKVKIQKVSDEMHNSINQAKSYLKINNEN